MTQCEWLPLGHDGLRKKTSPSQQGHRSANTWTPQTKLSRSVILGFFV